MLRLARARRARFIRAFLFAAPPGEEGAAASRLNQLAKQVFLAPKPPPTIQSKFKNRYYHNVVLWIRDVYPGSRFLSIPDPNTAT
jgi:hypothetical protein